MRIIDLSLPVQHGAGRLGLRVGFETPFRFDDVGWQGSSFSMFAHYGTHVDAPNHFIAGGDGIDLVPLERLVGPAAVVELRDHGRDAGVSADTLKARGRHVRRGDIAVLRTGWSDLHWGEERFWREGPYLQPQAADWLVERGVKAVVYDFSEEYAVRQPGFRGEDCEVHHKLLGSDIYNIEYVRGLGQLRQSRVTIIALPLRLCGLDGAPARVVALEGVELPAGFRAGRD